MADIITPDRLRWVWLDLEMTGLNVDRDFILEISTLITDGNLNLIARGPTIVIYQDETTLKLMDAWCWEQHTKSKLVDEVRVSPYSTLQAEQETLNFLKMYCKERQAILCGSSIWQDRVFLMRHMPSIHNFLHYRMIDVSSIKAVARAWYPTNPLFTLPKRETHRAQADVDDSIMQLQQLREHFWIPQ